MHFSFCKCCTALRRPTGPKLESPRPPAPLLLVLGGQEEADRSLSLPSARVKCTYDIYYHLVVRACSRLVVGAICWQQERQKRRRRRRQLYFPAEGLILRGIKRCQSNSTREDSQTASVGKCWCSELYKLMNCQCFTKTKVCHVLKVLERVGGASFRECEAGNAIGSNLSLFLLSACDLHLWGDDEPFLFFD